MNMRTQRLRALRRLTATLTAIAVFGIVRTEPLAAAQPVKRHPHVLNKSNTSGAETCSASLDNVANTGNGPVMTSLTAYLIFWLPTGTHFSNGTNPGSDGGDATYENLIMNYFEDVGNSPLYDILGQYAGSNGAPSNTVTLGGFVVDTTPYPAGKGSIANPLLDADLQAEIHKVITAKSWGVGLSNMYFVFTGSGIQSCFNSRTNDCTFVSGLCCSQDATSCDESTTCTNNFQCASHACRITGYCAYHSYFTLSGQPVIYANMPDAFSLNCGFFNITGDPSADIEINVLSHEHFEAVSDPLLDAWRDSNGCEIGDKCQSRFCLPSSPVQSDFNSPDIFLNQHPYRVQREWSNAAGGCALSLPGTDNCGVVPPDKETAMCEDKVAKNLARLTTCIAKCRITQADSAVRGTTFDEQACQQGPVSCRAAYDNAEHCARGEWQMSGMPRCENAELSSGPRHCISGAEQQSDLLCRGDAVPESVRQAAAQPS